MVALEDPVVEFPALSVIIALNVTLSESDNPPLNASNTAAVLLNVLDSDMSSPTMV